MTGAAFSLFDTAIGRAAIVWRGAEVIGTLLPERSPGLLKEALTRRFPGASEAEPPPPVARIVEGIGALLDGNEVAFDLAPLRLERLPEFDRRVYETASAIPAGSTRTYGELATALGQPGAARAVGAALGRNPFPILFPATGYCPREAAAAFPRPAASIPRWSCSRSRKRGAQEIRTCSRTSPWQWRRAGAERAQEGAISD